MSEFDKQHRQLMLYLKIWALLFLALSVNRTFLLQRDYKAVIQKNNLKRSGHEIQPHPER